MDKNVSKTLNYLYTTPGLPSAFCSINELWKSAKRYFPAIKKSSVQEWLYTRDAYTLHKLPSKRHQPRVLSKGIDDQWSADLCDMSNIAKHNEGTNFMLTVIDVFSKKADAEPVKNKSGKAVTEAFSRILARTYPRSPRLLETDHGKEFYNSNFQSLCNQQNMHLFSSQSAYKASTVERFNRTLKNIMYRYFTNENTYKWINVLPKIIETYNKRYHRSIKMSPNEVSNENAALVRQNLYGKFKKKTGNLLPIGTFVRISKTKRTFDKGYLPNFTEEIFRIYESVSDSKTFRYKLEDLAGERLIGSFCADEIQKVIKADNIWKIETVLSRRKLKGKQVEYLVSWKGFPAKFNSYVSERDIINLA